jgi:hypothetical protein
LSAAMLTKSSQNKRIQQIHHPQSADQPHRPPNPASPHPNSSDRLTSFTAGKAGQPPHPPFSPHTHTPTAMTGPPSSDLKQRLERKATFEAAVKELTGAHSDAAALELVPRVYTLLKARHTSPAAWKAGLELFRAVQVRVCVAAAAHACVDRLCSWGASTACTSATDNQPALCNLHACRQAARRQQHWRPSCPPS